MDDNNTEFDTNMYDVIFFWDKTKDDIKYKQYCSETLCNILGYTPALAVKIVYEAAENGRGLVLSTRNVEKATNLRNTLLALELSCQIVPTELK